MFNLARLFSYTRRIEEENAELRSKLALAHNERSILRQEWSRDRALLQDEMREQQRAVTERLFMALGLMTPEQAKEYGAIGGSEPQKLEQEVVNDPITRARLLAQQLEDENRLDEEASLEYFRRQQQERTAAAQRNEAVAY